MKLVMTLLVRDEEDILPSNIEFHLEQGVDYIIATDNLSGSAARDVLREYERLGCLHYLYQPEDIYQQDQWVTRMARLAHTAFGADWVINCDVDEFWWPEYGDLKRVLSEVSCDADAAAAARTNFVPRAMSRNEFFADVLTVRERHSLNALGQPLPGKICHRAFHDVDVAFGNHSASRDGSPLVTDTAPITILHLPMRSYEQFKNKIAKGGGALERNSNIPPAVAGTWRELFRLWKLGQLPEYYWSTVVAEDSIIPGVSQGRFVFDDRLQRFFAERRAADEALTETEIWNRGPRTGTLGAA